MRTGVRYNDNSYSVLTGQLARRWIDSLSAPCYGV